MDFFILPQTVQRPGIEPWAGELSSRWPLPLHCEPLCIKLFTVLPFVDFMKMFFLYNPFQSFEHNIQPNVVSQSNSVLLVFCIH
jgi:hypothetical protein